MDTQQSTDTVAAECLYNANKHAKKYAGLADDHYRRGKKTRAKENSVRKKALYKLKTDAINKLLKRDVATKAEYHIIGDEKYICVWFNNYSFHQPIKLKKVHTNWFPDISDKRELNNFESINNKEERTMTLKDSLIGIKDTLGLDANSYLEQTHPGGYFVGWDYL